MRKYEGYKCFIKEWNDGKNVTVGILADEANDVGEVDIISGVNFELDGYGGCNFDFIKKDGDFLGEDEIEELNSESPIDIWPLHPCEAVMMIRNFRDRMAWIESCYDWVVERRRYMKGHKDIPKEWKPFVYGNKTKE